ncbi:Dof zinc finger protein DOF5.6 [Abeliophyllum distichum]|uniref:Dof zinc finger protein DOF5.6 n=1 Tax=Abeliophyllum distichum TaxID=126358 RepID=A0ABD1RY90_9LAMI
MMALTSLQVCMDSSDWLQGTINEETGMNSSSSSPSGDMLACSRPLIERRLRPPHDQALKCPRRYWTKGGTLRNIPVGGGCRKNKKISSKKSSNEIHNHQSPSSSLLNQQNPSGILSSDNNNPTDLQLSFPDHMQFSHLNNNSFLTNPNFNILENPTPIDFMENKYDFLGNGDFGMMGNSHGLGQNFQGICSPFFGMNLDGNMNGTILDNSQRLMLPYENHLNHNNEVDEKPNSKILSLEWHDQQACSDAGKESFGYLGGLGTWTGLMNGYGSSATNPLV